ncbi:MAG: DMT family transporter [Thermodesulfobacteriota bacterium]
MVNAIKKYPIYAALLAAMLLWASSFIAMKLAFSGYDPRLVIFGRMAVATVCFLPIVGRLKGNRYRKGDIKYILFMALCEPCLYFIFEAKALENTTASQAGMITAMLPLMVALSAGLLLKERISRRTVFGFALAIAGAVWLSAGARPSEQAPHPALGNFLEFLAMACATGYTISLKYLTERYNPFFLTALMAFAGSIFFLPVLFMPSTVFPVRLHPVATLCIVYLGVFVTIGAFGLYNLAVSKIPANQATAFVNLIPVGTVLLGWLILNETLTPMQLLASALVIGGVVISQDKIPQAQQSDRR